MIDVERWLGAGGLAVLAAIVFAESGRLIGFFLPGDTRLFNPANVGRARPFAERRGPGAVVIARFIPIDPDAGDLPAPGRQRAHPSPPPTERGKSMISYDDGFTRRFVLIGLAATPLFVSSCGKATRGNGAKADVRGAFQLRHDHADVRCLTYDRAVSEERSGCLLIVLLHGAGADATQWFDIGLVDAVDHLHFGGVVHRVVAVAPDISDFPAAPNMVVESLLPHLDHRFAPGAVAISGISRGAAVALDVALAPGVSISSVGLHSPAIRLTAPIKAKDWPCSIDIGRDDPLLDAATQTSEMLRDSGVLVIESMWPGGHDRAYWRQHLPEYLGFHVEHVARRSP
jgi:predicted esterase